MTDIGAGIDEVARTTWATILHRVLERGGEGRVEPASAVTSVVAIDGPWRGAVVLECPQRLARSLAAGVLEGDGAPGDEEVGDLLGEVANIIAGNVKALLPGACRLSLPSVSFGPGDDAAWAGTAVVARVAFTSEGAPVVVSLVERGTDDGGGAGRR